MTKKIMKDWTPEQDLAALLDALAIELLAAPGDEVSACLYETGAKGRSAIEAVRRLVSVADADLDASPVSNFVVPGLLAHLTRNQ